MKQQHEVMGYTFKSDADLSRQLGKFTTYVNQLRRKGWTYEKIISHVLNPEPRITISGYTFKNNADLSRQLGKYTTYVHECRQRGWTYEKIISHVLDPESQEPQITISGYTFKNNADLSRQLGKYATYVSEYRRRGWSYEDIIKNALLKTPKTILGITFKNDADLSRQLNRNPSYVSLMKHNGNTYEEIINHAIQNRHRKYQSRSKVQTPKTLLGITFKNYSDLARQLGRSYEYVIKRIDNGMSEEDIIKNALPKTILGITFKSDYDLSRMLNKSAGFVSACKRRGMSYEEIIKYAINLDKAKR